MRRVMCLMVSKGTLMPIWCLVLGVRAGGSADMAQNGVANLVVGQPLDKTGTSGVPKKSCDSQAPCGKALASRSSFSAEREGLSAEVNSSRLPYHLANTT